MTGTQLYPFGQWVEPSTVSGTQLYPFGQWVEPTAAVEPVWFNMTALPEPPRKLELIPY